jgi:NADH-quinone oxidoreductase subunit L
MLDALWLIPAMPLAGFTVLALIGRRLPPFAVAAIGTGTVGGAMVLTLGIGAAFAASPGEGFTQTLWTWVRVGGFAPAVGFFLDGLSLVMVLVITIVAFLIHLYSTRFMAGDEGYSRFFAYMNLFVGSMLILVLADDLLLLYLGWEGVGLCSYLLIGFWYRDSANGRAAIKAFVVTRVGDTAFAIALFVLFAGLGTLQIQEIGRQAAQLWPVGSAMAVAAAALLLGGAAGKSAQLPLQTWLPDAMAGPTPVSALIHAATMVTAGVYLIARMEPIFLLAPGVRLIVALVGTATLLLAATSALAQIDIKRILAYSTMSQVGYMFLALGVGAWSAAIFHFMTHAFFKALLFLSAGLVIQALANEHDIFKMGGLRKRLPVAFWTFLVGAASLSAVPVVTAGFYSKELILSDVWSSPVGGAGFWLAGVAGAGLTAVYAFRAVFIVFCGAETQRPLPRFGLPLILPVLALALGALLTGFVPLPAMLDASVQPVQALSGGRFFPATRSAGMMLHLVTGAVSLLGILIAWFLYGTGPSRAAAFTKSTVASAVHRLWSVGWGFDWLYTMLVVKPFKLIARLNRDDCIDLIYRAAARTAMLGNSALTLTQSGSVRWYVAGVALGGAVFIGMVVLG